MRYPLLDDVAWQVYGSARDALERQDLALAAEGFGTAIRLTEELPTPLDAGITELRALAAGFRDLAERAIAVQEQAEAGSGATGTAGADGVDSGGAVAAEPVDDPDRIYSDDSPDVVKPAVVSRPLPPWIPPAGAEGRSFSGVIELVVSREGKVEAAQMLESIYPLYDSLLISVSRTWQFRPATRNGVPVRYRYRIAVRMGES
ncbi:MAG TPA: hypothetical protein VLA20_10340 [Vicinamibacterales bacterium]|nr:hypothetical protein [Vicinamibacterales bacterium]